ncbi:MAG: hypothetical protein N2517_09185 [Ignavibacteria bacterium]|nr:hypothetical protein [Ignavibacteria bacterium]
MTKCEFISKIDNFTRGFLVAYLPKLSCAIYSSSRKKFIDWLVKERPQKIVPPENLKVKLWDIEFRSPIFNAAGVFKDGRGYELSFLQGAGAFLAGTVTLKPRTGNIISGITHPFLPFPCSLSSLNSMGLPNPGYEKVLATLSKTEKQKGMPIGLSLAYNYSFEELKEFCKILPALERSNIDFIEINESCPNVKNNVKLPNQLDEDFLTRLDFFSKNFLKKRTRNLPVVLKLSNDFSIECIPQLIEFLLDFGFDGLNFGNTSTDYENIREQICPAERKAFDLFSKRIGGGVSGKPLQDKSFRLTEQSCSFLKKIVPRREFHIFRTGGIFDSSDIKKSNLVGVTLFQWFTGYFHMFNKFGHRLYFQLYHSLLNI